MSAITRRLCRRHFVDKSQSRFRQVAEKLFFSCLIQEFVNVERHALSRVQLSLILVILRRRKTLKKELETPPRRDEYGQYQTLVQQLRLHYED